MIHTTCNKTHLVLPNFHLEPTPQATSTGTHHRTLLDMATLASAISITTILWSGTDRWLLSHDEYAPALTDEPSLYRHGKEPARLIIPTRNQNVLSSTVSIVSSGCLNLQLLRCTSTATKPYISSESYALPESVRPNINQVVPPYPD